MVDYNDDMYKPLIGAKMIKEERGNLQKKKALEEDLRNFLDDCYRPLIGARLIREKAERNSH